MEGLEILGFSATGFPRSLHIRLSPRAVIRAALITLPVARSSRGSAFYFMPVCALLSCKEESAEPATGPRVNVPFFFAGPSPLGHIEPNEIFLPIQEH